MVKWEVVFNKFIEDWKYKYDVKAALVCGSYITGNPSKRSDLDIHIILFDDVDWRERGNKIIDDLLIEYFVKLPKQIRKHFQDDNRNRRIMSIVKFITGKVLFDKSNVIQQLKIEAQEWKNKKYENTIQVFLEIKKYNLGYLG
ncbi:nucleotidyltransferase domain-containing protein [Niallia sp. 03133]|uniref:nucleotidyltransferase domain-containing protein n=1 Tax=Niallia sp. 03133 TaxID=3458060 RepID=UPI004043DBFF